MSKFNWQMFEDYCEEDNLNDFEEAQEYKKKIKNKKNNFNRDFKNQSNKKKKQKHTLKEYFNES